MFFVGFEDKCENPTILCGEKKFGILSRGALSVLNNLSPNGCLRRPRGLLSLGALSLIVGDKPTSRKVKIYESLVGVSCDPIPS